MIAEIQCLASPPGTAEDRYAHIEAAIAVDTHVFRVSHRLGLANAGTPDKVEAQLFRVVPEGWLPKAHHWLILHGRYTCTARRPGMSTSSGPTEMVSDEKVAVAPLRRSSALTRATSSCSTNGLTR